MPEELMPVKEWWGIADSLPKDAPDTLYDAQREKYFEQVVMPWAGQQGYGETQAWISFKKATERPGKSSYPRAAVATTSALESFGAPLGGIPAVSRAKRAAIQESEKQGVGTTLPEIAGQMVGEAPYWMVGMEAAGGVAGAVKAAKAAKTLGGGEGPLMKATSEMLTSKGAIDRAVTVGAAGAIQGSYNAAKSPDHPIMEGLTGFAEGAAFVGALEMAGPLWRSIRGVAPKVTVEEAKAVEAVAKGVATPVEEKISAKVINANPEVMNHVKSWVAQKIKDIKKTGLPETPPEVEHTGKIKLSIRGKDNKVITAGGPNGLDSADLPKLVGEISKWLDNGAQISNVRGDPAVLDDFYRRLSSIREKENAEPIAMKGEGKTLVVAEKPTLETPAETPPPAKPEASVEEKLDKYKQMSTSLKDMGRDTEILDSLLENYSPDMDEFIQDEIKGMIKVAKERQAGFRMPEESPLEQAPKADLSDAEKFALAPDETKVKDVNKMFESLETGKKKKAAKLRTGEKAPKIDASQLSPETRFETRYDGKVKDIVDGRIYPDMQSAMKSVGIEVKPDPANPRPGMDDPFSRRDILKRGAGAAAGAAASDLGGIVEQAQHAASSGNEDLLEALKPYLLEASSHHLTESIPVDLSFAHGGRYVRVIDNDDISNLLSIRQLLDRSSSSISTILQVQKDMAKGMKFTREDISSLVDSTDWLSLDDLDVLRRNINTKTRIFKDISEKIPIFEDANYISRASAIQKADSDGLSFADLANSGISKGEVDYSSIDTYLRHKDDPDWREVHRGVLKDAEKLIETKPELYKEVKAVHDRTIQDQQRYEEHVRRQREFQDYEESKTTALTRTPAQLGEEGKGGIMMRYGIPAEGGLNLPTGEVERPMQIRSVINDPADFPMDFSGAGGMSMVAENYKPRIYYLSGNIDKGIMFHEGLHGQIGYTGLTQHVADLFEDGMGQKLINAFSPDVVKAYKANGMWGEEVFAYLSQAVRTKNHDWIQAFVDSDGSRQELMTYLYKKTNNILEELATRNDSMYSRRLASRLEDLKIRAGSIADLEASAERTGYELGYSNGEWELFDPRESSLLKFKTREELEDHLSANNSTPLMAPELVDISFMPEGIPRASFNSAIKSSSVPPIQTDPIPMNPPPGGPIKGGWKPFSFFLRPRENWFEAVSKENRWPELYDSYRRVIDAQQAADKFVEGWEQKLKDIMGEGLFADANRRKAVGAYRHAKGTEAAAKDLNLSPEEIAVSKKITEEITDPLYKEFGIGDHAKYVEEYLPRIKAANWDPDQLKPSPKLSPEELNFWAELNRVGNLDPRDNDIATVLGAYIRGGAKKKFMEEPLADLARLNNLKTDTGAFQTGNLQPLIDRTIRHWRGQPDYTQNVINGAMNAFLNGLKQTVGKINKKLPESMQVEALDNLEGSDILGKWTTLMYAGSLGFRPMAYVRDGLQFMMTTYPLLGGKYLLSGLKTVIEGSKEGRQGYLYSVAKSYGAITEHSPLADLYSTTGQVEQTKLMKLANYSMKGLKWENDVNRLISFWGHQRKAFDGITESPGDVVKQVKASGITWLPDLLKEKFITELKVGPKDVEDLSFRVAKELTDMSQWNYTRGASPGAYKYAMGRLFGMYGTWPMNYIEYIRTIARQSDPTERNKAIARLLGTHYTILAAGQGMGIDTANWVFAQPGAFGGSPVFNSVMSIPQSLDFETTQGDKARRQLIQPVYPLAIPGGLTITKLLEAITQDKPDAWLTILGFKPLAPHETEKGLHNLVP